MAISKGTVRVVNGTYQPIRSSEMERRVRRGNVRMDSIKGAIPPPFEYRQTDDGKNTFEMNIRCVSKVHLLKSGIAVETDNYVRNEKTIRSLGEKNITQQIKLNACQYSGYEEASKLRKRIIQTQKLKNLNDQEFIFDIE